MIKYRLVYIFFTILFLMVIGKLFYLQVIRSPSFYGEGYLTNQKLFPKRGRIYDINHQPLAVNQISYRLFAEPKKITDKQKLVASLDQVLTLGEATISSQIDDSKEWILIKDQLDQSVKELLDKMHLAGIGFEESSKRYYPEASLAAHLLGFVGKNYYGEDIGYFGIEGYYNDDLSGLPGVIKSERDLLGRPILIGTQEKIDPENGRDLYLTIDKAVQMIVKDKLAKGLETYQAKEGCIIVVDPNSAAVLALSCLPDYDLDHYYQFSEDFFKNPAISDLYEPGSTFKPLIMAAALEEGVIKPLDLYNEAGPIQIGEYSIKTWNDRYEGKITMTRILEKSSNVGMVYIGQRLGNKKIYQYLNKFEFGRLTGIDLQGESSGYLKPLASWYPIDFATVTFGQGIAVTPIQMIRAFISLINGGKLYRPHVVKKIGSENDIKKIQPKLESTILSNNTSEIMKKMLRSAVDNGEIKWMKPEGYTIGGKTGTAQIAIKGHYDPSKTIASFIGFAPIDQPKFAVIVILKEPKTSPWGSETAAPLFFEITKELIVYYNIAPE